MLKYSKRDLTIQFIVFCATILVTLYVYYFINFHEWRDETRSEVEAGSQIIKLQSGTIEYSVIGDGEAAMWFHGVGSGYDQRKKGIEGLQLISVSRPGYLRTTLNHDLPSKKIFEIYRELIDHLSIDRLNVIGFSAGAISALKFAEHYPNRSKKVILISGITKEIKYDEPTYSFEQNLLEMAFGDDFLGFQHVNRIVENPVQFIRKQTKFFSNEDIELILKQDDLIYDIIVYEIHTAATRSMRFPGHMIDHRQTQEFGETQFTFENPTLIVHGTEDKDINFDHAKSAHKRIPNAELKPITGAGHYLIFSRPNVVDSLIADFINRKDAN